MTGIISPLEEPGVDETAGLNDLAAVRDLVLKAHVDVVPDGGARRLDCGAAGECRAGAIGIRAHRFEHQAIGWQRNSKRTGRWKSAGDD